MIRFEFEDRVFWYHTTWAHIRFWFSIEQLNIRHRSNLNRLHWTPHIFWRVEIIEHVSTWNRVYYSLNVGPWNSYINVLHRHSLNFFCTLLPWQNCFTSKFTFYKHFSIFLFYRTVKCNSSSFLCDVYTKCLQWNDGNAMRKLLRSCSLIECLRFRCSHFIVIRNENEQSCERRYN